MYYLQSWGTQCTAVKQSLSKILCVGLSVKVRYDAWNTANAHYTAPETVEVCTLQHQKHYQCALCSVKNITKGHFAAQKTLSMRTVQWLKHIPCALCRAWNITQCKVERLNHYKYPLCSTRNITSVRCAVSETLQTSIAQCLKHYQCTLGILKGV